MKLALVMFLNLIFVVILFGGIFYQCIITKEHPALGIYTMVSFWINYYIVFNVIAKWLKKIFDIND